MIKIFLLLVLFFPSAAHVMECPDTSNETVVLLHGIGRNARFMAAMARYLEDYGYETLNITYPSQDYPIEELVERVHEKIEEKNVCSTTTVHFVGHSMGNLIIRGLIAQHRPANLGRVVMVGPPNQGSEVADFLKDNWFYQKFFGPAGQQLTTDLEPLQDFLDHDLDYEVGIIAGNSCIDRISSFLTLEGANDGLVSVERTKLPGMTAHIVIDTSHTFMMLNEEVMKQTLHFLKTGTFMTPIPNN